MQQQLKLLYYASLKPYEQKQAQEIVSEKASTNRRKNINGMGKNKYEHSRKIMLATAEKTAFSQELQIFDSRENCQFTQTRRNNCVSILKFLLFGYLQLKEELHKKAILKLGHNPNNKSIQFMNELNSYQKSINPLKKKAILIQKGIYQFCNTAGSAVIQSKKYRFQIGYLLRNIQDIFNGSFRQAIINGSISPQYLALMDEIDMLQPRKKQFVFTRNISLLNNQQRLKKRNMRQSKYESVCLKNLRKQRLKSKQVSFKNNLQNKGLQYYFSRSFIQKLQMQLMEIPFKSTRKIALKSLRSVFYK